MLDSAVMHIPHLSSNPRVPVDRFGQPLSPGDLVVYDPRSPVVYRVADIRPILDPKAPPGAMQVTLTASAFVSTAHGVPIGELLRIGYADGPNSQPMIGSPYRHPDPQGGATRALHDPAQDPAVPAHNGTDVPAVAHDDTVPAGIHLVRPPDVPS